MGVGKRSRELGSFEVLSAVNDDDGGAWEATGEPGLGEAEGMEGRMELAVSKSFRTTAVCSKPIKEKITKQNGKKK